MHKAIIFPLQVTLSDQFGVCSTGRGVELAPESCIKVKVTAESNVRELRAKASLILLSGLIIFEYPMFAVQEIGVFRSVIIFDFGPAGCIGRRLEAVFDLNHPEMPPVAPSLPYQPRHRALPTRVDTMIIPGVKPDRNSVDFARVPRPHAIPRRLQAMFDAKNDGGLRSELERPIVDLVSFAHKVRLQPL